MVEQTALAAQELPLPPERPSPSPVKTRLKEAGGLVFCVAFGFAIALGPMRYLPELSLLHLLAALILLPLMLWLQLLLHEAGHIIAGTVCGKRLLAAGVGPWRVERKETGWQLRRAGAIQGIGGFAVLLPTDPQNDPRWKNAIYILGGPTANLVSAGLVSLLYMSLSEQPLLVQLGLFIFIGTGLLLGLVNLLPLVSGGWPQRWQESATTIWQQSRRRHPAGHTTTDEHGSHGYPASRVSGTASTPRIHS